MGTFTRIPSVPRALAVLRKLALVGLLVPVGLSGQTPLLPSSGVPTGPSLGGVVRVEGGSDARLLAGALVEVRQGERIRRAEIDREGRYRVDGLSPGSAAFTVLHLGIRPVDLELRLPERGEVRLDLSVERRLLVMPEVRARGLPDLNRPATPVSGAEPRRVALGMRVLEASPGMVESGLASSIPGEDGTTPDRVLYMRGSTVDARVVLLDGAPILTPFHVAGLVEPFDPDWVGGAELYLGGAPSPYDGGVSYLLDLDTRPARRDGMHGGVTLDGLQARGFAEVPLPRGGLLVGGRGLHGLQGALAEGERLPYRYEDLLVRLGVDPLPGHALRFTAFGNREGVRLDVDGEDPAPGPEARWGNEAASVGYEGLWGPVGVDLTAASSRYTSALPVPWDDPVLARGEGARSRLNAVAAVPTGPGLVRMGASVERIGFRYRLDPLEGAFSTLISAGGEEVGTTAAGVFGEWEGWVTPEVHLRFGLRGDRFSHEGRARVAPRIALRYLLGERASLFASAGSYHQPLPAPGLEGEGFGDEPARLTWNPALPVVTASHLVVGLDQELEGGVRLGLSGFVKGFEGLEGRNGGRSRSSGTELTVGRGGDRFEAWLGYALSWFWMQEGVQGSTRFDGRHLLSLGAVGTMPGGLEVRGTLGYGAGLPLTAVDVGREPESPILTGVPQSGPRELTSTDERRMNSGAGDTPLDLAPQEDFLRMDLEVGWPREVRVNGRATHLRPYVKLLNALDRRDALFYYFDRWRGDEVRPLAHRPFLPLLGLEWRF